MRSSITRIIAAIACAASLLTAPTAQAVDNATWGQIKNAAPQTEGGILSFGQAAAQEFIATRTLAGKQIAPRRAVRDIGPQGGNIRVISDEEAGQPDYWKVRLRVPEDALDATTPISIRVYGRTLSDMIVEFGPAGLVFNTEAILIIQVGSNRTDLAIEQLETMNHTYSDGTSEPLDVQSVETADGVTTIKVRIPGFSRYSIWKGAAKKIGAGGLAPLPGEDGGLLQPLGRYSPGGGW